MDADAERAFQHIVARLDYPMFVLTAAAGGERSGCLIGFTSQCSIHPPRFAVWVSEKNHTFGVARRAEVLAVEPFAAESDDTPSLTFQVVKDLEPGHAP